MEMLYALSDENPGIANIESELKFLHGIYIMMVVYTVVYMHHGLL